MLPASKASPWRPLAAGYRQLARATGGSNQDTDGTEPLPLSCPSSKVLHSSRRGGAGGAGVAPRAALPPRLVSSNSLSPPLPPRLPLPTPASCLAVCHCRFSQHRVSLPSFWSRLSVRSLGGTKVRHCDPEGERLSGRPRRLPTSCQEYSTASAICSATWSLRDR